MKSKILLLIFITFSITIIAWIQILKYISPPGTIDRAKHSATRPKMAQIETAISYFVRDTGKYPAALVDLITPPSYAGPSWQGPYLRKESHLYDPWGNQFVYEPNSSATYGYDLISYGKDGKPGGKGYNMDITNN